MYAVHIPGVDNKVVDALSRVMSDGVEHGWVKQKVTTERIAPETFKIDLSL